MFLTNLVAGIWDYSLPMPVALAVVATFGYLMGRRNRGGVDVVHEQARREIKRARVVASELEQIATSIRSNLALHESSLTRFKERVHELSAHEREASWKELCKEAEEVLRPTLRLASQIASAYDELRHQSSYLMSFTEVRTDPLTGVSNRRAMDEMLDAMTAMFHRYEHRFSLAIFDIDHFKAINDREGHLTGDKVLKLVAKILDDGARETDFVARYGGEEFILVMPSTDAPGACISAERLRARVEQSNVKKLKLTISAGVATSEEGDDAASLLARADAALYESKAAGRNCVFLHYNGELTQITGNTELTGPPLKEPELTQSPLPVLDVDSTPNSADHAGNV